MTRIAAAVGGALRARASSHKEEAMQTETATELVGRAIGALLAPVAALVAKVRGGRALHPAGTVCAAEVIAAAEDPTLAELAQRLAGGAIVRLSGALWRHPGGPEMLGCALRLRGPRTLTPEVDPADQDLLFATARAPWSIALATFTTDPRDYLRNVYYTIGRLEVAELGQVELRLVPLPLAAPPGETRRERLEAAMEAGQARLRLEVRGRDRWQVLCEVRLRGRLAIDSAALCFSPYQNGLGLEPRGILHAMRGPTYAAGQGPRVGRG